MKRFLAGMLALAAVHPAAAAAQPPNPGAAPSNAITIDLNAASQTGRVDFDVPIVLQIPIQSDITNIDVFKTESKSKAACGDHTAFPAVAANSWRRFDLGRAADSPVTAAAAPTTAYITVDPVDANRYLCFKFSITRMMSPGEIKTFAEQAAAEADIRLRSQLLRPDGFTGDQVEELRQALRVALGVTQPAPGGELHRSVKPGSMLAEDMTRESRIAFTGFLGSVFAATLNRKSIIDDLKNASGQVDSAVQALLEALADPLLKSLAGKNPAVDLLLTVPGASSDLTRGRATAVATGVPLGTVDTGFDRMWDPADVDPRLRAVRDWLGTLAAVQAFVSDAPADVVAPPIAVGDRAALARKLAAARAALEAVGSTVANLREALVQRHDAVATFAANIGDRVAADAIVGTSSFADFNTRSTWYLSIDAGLAFAPRLKSAFPYAGGNIYFRPVNKEAPLSLRGSFGRRFSAMVGASFFTDLTKPGEIENSLGDRMLLVGAGFRLTDILRFGAGAVVVQALSPNPLITTDVGVQLTPFFSLSIDWDAKGTFQKAFTETNK